MNEIDKLVRRINWRLLRKQKIHLLQMPDDELTDGVIGLIDALQDAVVAEGVATEKEVFYD